MFRQPSERDQISLGKTCVGVLIRGTLDASGSSTSQVLLVRKLNQAIRLRRPRGLILSLLTVVFEDPPPSKVEDTLRHTESESASTWDSGRRPLAL